MKVYKRTSEGQWAAYDEHSPLPRKLKILLKAINGKVPEDVYVKNLGSFGDVRALLMSLEQAGLIADKGHRAAKTTALGASPRELDVAPPVSAPAALAKPAMDQTIVIPNLEGLRRPSAVAWQALPELTELSMPAALAAPKPPAALPAQTTPSATHVRPEPNRAPPVLTQVVARPDVAQRDEMDALAALADLAEMASQSAPAAHAARASNMLTHNALLAANDEPIQDASGQRGAVRHAVELMSNFVLDHLPRSASQVLPEIESLHSVDQWAELMDGYAVFITPTGELGRAHMQHIRRLLEQALSAADVGSKGWYA
jgi:hypothetical protein